MPEFRRKDDYSQEVYDAVKKLRSLKGQILAVPGEDGIICYYRGLPLVTIKETGRGEKRRISYCKFGSDYNKYFTDENQGDELLERIGDDYKSVLYDKDDLNKLLEIIDGNEVMKHDRERRTQQILALKSITENHDYMVCGFETAISKEFFEEHNITVKKKKKDGTIQDKTPKPEIDLVLYSPKHKRMVLAEFKCTNAARTCYNNGVIAHGIDYSHILSLEPEIELIEEMRKAYRVMCGLYNKTCPDELPVDSLDIVFLLTGTSERSVNGDGKDITKNGNNNSRNALKNCNDKPLNSFKDRIFWYWEHYHNNVKFNHDKLSEKL